MVRLTDAQLASLDPWSSKQQDELTRPEVGPSPGRVGAEALKEMSHATPSRTVALEDNFVDPAAANTTHRFTDESGTALFAQFGHVIRVQTPASNTIAKVSLVKWPMASGLKAQAR